MRCRRCNRLELHAEEKSYIGDKFIGCKENFGWKHGLIRTHTCRPTTHNTGSKS